MTVEEKPGSSATTREEQSESTDDNENDEKTNGVAVNGDNGSSHEAAPETTETKSEAHLLVRGAAEELCLDLAHKVERHFCAIANKDQSNIDDDTFVVTPQQLGALAEERTRVELASLLDRVGASSESATNGVKESSNGDDVESPSLLSSLTTRIRELNESNIQEHSIEEMEADRNAEAAATTLTTLLLKSNPEKGISNDADEIQKRIEYFGTNAMADKKLDSFLQLCWEAVQDFVLIMLIVLGIISVIVETTIGLDEGEKCGVCWIEGAFILFAVCIVVLITAGIDYTKQFAFIRLTRTLHETNTKQVIRDGKQMSVIDDDIVVGDILSVNSHQLASIPADCLLLGPMADLKMDESSLTGESKLITKKPGDVVLSGTTAVQGQGKMVVIAVGTYSVAGKIKARVYETAEDDGDDDELGGDDENSPLFVKLDLIAKQIGLVGTIAAVIAFVASCIIGLAIQGDDVKDIIDYLITAITVLAVAVPEGLPLAVTLALAFSSNQMMKEQNLVKHLDACETMGCATTICTDKTGTLTANKMTARSLYTTKKNFSCTDPSLKLADYMKTHDGGTANDIIELLTVLISIDTMDETVLHLDSNNKAVTGTSGNPTEVALLMLVHELGGHYDTIRNSTRGRADQGELAEHLSDGKQFGFSSARKMMSWAVPKTDGDGGYRLYSKGAAEVVIGRCDKQILPNGITEDISDSDSTELNSIAENYARRGQRTLCLAYKDLPAGTDLEAVSSTIKNSDGSDALVVETDMVFVAIVGIEDPLRPEVPPAIEKCYEAGIDVRMVTGDNPNTAVSIAHQAGIIRDFHFKPSQGGSSKDREMVASNLKENVLMEGKTFRSKVYRIGDEGNKEFDQAAFDKIWPHLRVLARSSPDDKLTLAHGLNQSTLFAEKEVCEKLRKEDNIAIFPDRQVIAMTGDGTNDAPALKRADIGFAMGVAGTQIAKDAADIILLDDNFASIVTAAKWGRNIYASIQKFLQFQLTVNISAVITALTGAIAYQTSPLAAIQLLWVNLLMDSLASLALASEPPVDALLKKPPVNRTEHMITKRMWANMLGQAAYQIAVVMVLLFAGPQLLDVEPGHEVEDRGDNSVHYTIIFNVFVWMQLFNEINCRQLKGEFNVFKGLFKNRLFCGIWLSTAVLQVLIVEFGSVAFHVADDGLDGKWWGLSIGLGVASFPVQWLINLFYGWSKLYKGYRQNRRLKHDTDLVNRHTE